MEIKRFVLSEFQVNNYLVINNKEAVLIDVGFDPDNIEKYIIEKELTLKAILLTHAHLDHIGGLEKIRNNFNAEVYIHHLENEWLSNPCYNGSDAFPFFGEVICKPADHLIQSEEKLTIGTFNIQVIETPGHTPGGVSYLINNNLFTGDTLFYRSVGRTDLYGGDHIILVKSIKESLFKLPKSTVIMPGHGIETTIAEEISHNPFV